MIIELMLGAAALAAAAYLFWRWYRKREEEANQPYQSPFAPPQSSPASAGEKSQAPSDPSDSAKEEAFKKLLEGDELLAKQAIRSGGLGTTPVSRVRSHAALIRQGAMRIPDETLQVLTIAGTQRDVVLNVRTGAERMEVMYPTGDVEIGRVRDMSEMALADPTVMLLDDDQFNVAVAEQSLPVTRYYETQVIRRKLYLLRDISGSMNDSMANGTKRHVWARGVAISLLLATLKGEAIYADREFDDSVKPMRMVTNPDQAQSLIDELSRYGNIGGGTNIRHAMLRAIEDIRNNPEVNQTEIVLITDADAGRDSFGDPDDMMRRMGSDVRLHVAFIGEESASIRKAAVSCKSFR